MGCEQSAQCCGVGAESNEYCSTNLGRGRRDNRCWRTIMWLTLIFRDQSRKSTVAIMHYRISMLCQESAPRKDTVLFVKPLPKPCGSTLGSPYGQDHGKRP